MLEEYEQVSGTVWVTKLLKLLLCILWLHTREQALIKKFVLLFYIPPHTHSYLHCDVRMIVSNWHLHN